MRRLPTLLLLLLAVVVVPATTADPALAKGATEVTVSGPGIDDQTLGFTRRTSDVDVGSLAEATNNYGIWGDGTFVHRPRLTADQLGPRYTLTWYEGEVRMVVSHVYPFAEDGAWAEVPDGQRLWGEPVETGWWHGGTALEEQLVSLGAPTPAGDGGDAAADAGAAAGAVDVQAPTPPASSPGLPLVATGSAVVAGLAMLAGAVWWARRRRLHPVRPV